jgi:hypothetical protein
MDSNPQATNPQDALFCILFIDHLKDTPLRSLPGKTWRIVNYHHPFRVRSIHSACGIIEPDIRHTTSFQRWLSALSFFLDLALDNQAVNSGPIALKLRTAGQVQGIRFDGD